jgi:hypothetical protein
MSVFRKVENLVTASRIEAKTLSAKDRAKLPDNDFCFPKTRSYPIADISHARNALSRASAFGSAQVKRVVYKKVFERYPELRKEHSKLM